MTLKLRRDDIVQAARRCGFALAGISNFAEIARERSEISRWLDLGYAGEMGYLGRTLEILDSPNLLLPEAGSVISVVVHYDRTPRPELKRGYGRVARYAWGRDYHDVLPRRLRLFAEELARRSAAELKFRCFSDAVPLPERGAARRSGLGFIGKNTLCIQPRLGSFSFLGEIVCNATVSDSALPVIDQNSCKSCSRCIDSCPTGAIVAPFQIDARRCISYLTIEKRSALSPAERSAIGEWVFGCDVCQDVCPFNHQALSAALPAEDPEFAAAAGSGAQLALEELLAIRSNREFSRRFSGSAIRRATRAGLLRNAAIVAANTAAVAVVPALLRAVESDRSALVRRHALWALSILLPIQGSDGGRRFGKLMDVARADPAPELQEEIAAIESGLIESEFAVSP